MKNSMKKLIALTLALVLTSFSAAAQSGWARQSIRSASMIPVTSRAGAFSALMPGTPTYKTKQRTTKDGGSTTVHEFACESADGNYAYLVIYNDFANAYSSSEVEKAYDDAIQSGAQSINGRVVKTVPISQDGYPARITRVESSDYVGVWKLAIVGKRLYQAIFIMRKNAAVPDEAEKFLNSFRIG